MCDILNPFDEKASCQKCASEKISVKYVKEELSYMLRTCERCSFSWRELPLDVYYSGDEDEDEDET